MSLRKKEKKEDGNEFYRWLPLPPGRALAAHHRWLAETLKSFFEPLCQVRSADCLQHISRGRSTYATVLLWSVLHQRLLAIQTTVLLVV